MQIKINGKTVKLPDFLIVGAAKSGTTSIYHYLKQHPQIFMPKNKEPWFFSFAGIDRRDVDIFRRKFDIVDNFDGYLDLFKDANDTQVLGEASTCYLYLYRETIENIKKYHPNWKGLKIIVILRNPLERAFSHHLDDARNGPTKLSFEDVLEKWQLKQLPKLYNYVDYGFYYKQVSAYKDNFSHVRVYLFEDLKMNATSLVQDIFGFLGVDASFNPDTSLEYNSSTSSKNKFFEKIISNRITRFLLPLEVKAKIKKKILKIFIRKPQIENSTRKYLTEIYKDDILKLQDLINKDLTIWLQ